MLESRNSACFSAGIKLSGLVLNGMKEELSSMDCIQKDSPRTSYYQKFHYQQTLTSIDSAGLVVFVYFASDHTLASSQQIWQEGDTCFS